MMFEMKSTDKVLLSCASESYRTKTYTRISFSILVIL